jgi:hypothetical protein
MPEMATAPPITPPLPPAPLPIPTPPSQQQPEIEYRSLTGYFDRLVKYTYGAILLVLAAVSVFLWRNTGDIQDQAARSIKETQQLANAQIASIQKEASTIATSEAQKAVAAALEKQNVQSLIERTAREKVDVAVEQRIQTDLAPKIDAFKKLVTEIGEISNHGTQLRLGFRSGLDYLLKQLDSRDEPVRSYARSTLTLIGLDYEQRIHQFVGEDGDPIGLAGLTQQTNVNKALMETIRKSTDPMAVAAAFMAIQKRVDWKVPTFDLPAAEKWCSSHKPQCDQ